jgi:hypothetical protein
MSLAIERSKDRRDRRSRWLVDRRQLYASFTAGAVDLAFYMARSAEYDAQYVRTAIDRLAHQQSEIWLIGGEEVNAVACDICDHLKSGASVRAAEAVLNASWLEKHGEDRERFFKVARAELQVEP